MKILEKYFLIKSQFLLYSVHCARLPEVCLGCEDSALSEDGPDHGARTSCVLGDVASLLQAPHDLLGQPRLVLHHHRTLRSNKVD